MPLPWLKKWGATPDNKKAVLTVPGVPLERKVMECDSSTIMRVQLDKYVNFLTVSFSVINGIDR